MRPIVLALLGLLALPALAGEAPTEFRDRPRAGQPVRFTDAAGHVFQPDRLVLLSESGARAAALPAATHRAASEDRLDLSGVPLLGRLFPPRLAPGDARRQGTPVGSLRRLGTSLVLELRAGAPALAGRPVVLTANLPRDGAVSYRLGRLAFAPAESPGARGRPAGEAWLVGDFLVLAGPDRAPLIEDWGQVFDKALQ